MPSPEDYYPPLIYSPWELPANTAAARRFTDANPAAVDRTLELPSERMMVANSAIQEHVDSMAALGITVVDPRLPVMGGGPIDPPPIDPPPIDPPPDGGGGPPDIEPPPPDPAVTSISPTSCPKGTAQPLTVNGVSLTGTTKVTLATTTCLNLTVVSSTKVTCVVPDTLPKGTAPVRVTVSGTVITGPNFTVI